MNNWHSYCRDSITIYYLHVPWRECFWACRQFPVSNRLALSRSLNRWSSGGTLTTGSRPEPWGRRWMSGGFQLRNASKIPSGGATGRQGRRTDSLKKFCETKETEGRTGRNGGSQCLNQWKQVCSHNQSLRQLLLRASWNLKTVFQGFGAKTKELAGETEE